MSDDDLSSSAAGEPFAWGFYQQLPGRLGSVVLCTVRKREEANDLRGQGIDVFPLYSEAALRQPIPPASSAAATQGMALPSLHPTPPFGHASPATHDGEKGWKSDSRPPVAPDIFGLPSGAEHSPSPGTMSWAFSARTRTGSDEDSSPPQAANNPLPSTPGVPASHLSFMREVLRPFAQMASLVEGQEEDETVLSLQAGPLQWRHLTVGDLRRARSLYLATDD